MTTLGTLLDEQGRNSSGAGDVSADGSVVVGTSMWGTFGNYRNTAFIWDAQNGMRALEEVLTNQYGLDLGPWRLGEAHGISADGMTIVGTGNGLGNRIEGWIVRLGWTLTVNVQGQGSVQRDLDRDGYNTGTPVSLTADAAAGWHFVRWEGDATGTNPTVQVTMNANTTVQAVFEEDQVGPVDANDPNQGGTNNGCGYGASVGQLACWWMVCLLALFARRSRGR